MLLFASVWLYLFLKVRVICLRAKKFYAAFAHPVWTGHWLAEEEAKEDFLVGTGVAKEGFLVGNVKGKTGFQFRPVELVQMPWAGDKDTATAALAGSNHPEMNSGQVSPAVWISEIGPTATTGILLANSKVLKEDLSG